MRPALKAALSRRPIQMCDLINRRMDPRLGTRDAWKVMQPVTDELRRIEDRHGHMSDEYAAKLGEANALRREDYARNFFRQMGVKP